MFSNEADYKEETQAVQTQKRSQGRDAESGMIINNALRNRNQKECLTTVKRATEAGGTAGCSVIGESTSPSCLFWCYLRQQGLIDSESIWLFFPVEGKRKKKENKANQRVVSCNSIGSMVQKIRKMKRKRSELMEFYYKTVTSVTLPLAWGYPNCVH